MNHTDRVHKVMYQQAKGLLTEDEMWQEILEIAHDFLIGDYQVNEGVSRER
jgi:hypothetical protein